MKMVVTVRVGMEDDTGRIDRTAPFLVTADIPPPGTARRAWLCNYEREIASQLDEGEKTGRFSAEWIDGEWKFGKRIWKS